MPSAKLILPLPEVRISEAYDFDPCLTVMPLSDQQRRQLIDAVKRCENYSDDVLRLLDQTQCVVCKDCPIDDELQAILFQQMAEWIGREFLDCLQLSEWFDLSRTLILPSCGFLANIESPSLKYNDVKALQWKWRPTCIEEEASLVSDPNKYDRAFADLATLWPRLKQVCDFETIENQLDLNDPERQKRYVDAGNARIGDHAEESAKAVIEESQRENPEITYPNSWAERSFVQGYADAFLAELHQLKQKRLANRVHARLPRSLQFFVQSARLEQPFHFVALQESVWVDVAG